MDLRPPSTRLQTARARLRGLGLELTDASVWHADLPVDLHEQMVAQSSTRDFRAGEVLIRKGEPVQALYLVETGEVRSSTVTPDGQEFVLHLFEPGSCVGIISVFDEAASLTTCHAYCDSRLRVLPRTALLGILDKHPEYYRQFLALALHWLRAMLSMLEDQAVLGVRARMAKRLLQLAYIYGEATSDGIVIPFKLPQEELSMLLGATRQGVHKQLREFRDNGWVSLKNSVFTLHDIDALARSAKSS